MFDEVEFEKATSEVLKSRKKSLNFILTIGRNLDKDDGRCGSVETKGSSS